MVDYKREAHTLYDIKYHFVWVTKYRYPVLRGEVALSAREFIRRVCLEREVIILKGHVGKDHVHLFVSCPPRIAPASLMQSIKGKSSRYLMQGASIFTKALLGPASLG